jgi:hypothetical protein
VAGTALRLGQAADVREAPLFGASYASLVLLFAYVYAVAWYNQKVSIAKEWAADVKEKAPGKEPAEAEKAAAARKKEQALRAQTLRQSAAEVNKEAGALAERAKAPKGVPPEAAAAAGRITRAAEELAALNSDLGEKAIELERRAARAPHDATLSAARTVEQRLHRAPVSWRTWLALFSAVLLAVASTTYRLACPARVQECSRTEWCDKLGKPLLYYWSLSWERRPLRLLCGAFYALGGGAAVLLFAVKLCDVSGLIWQQTIRS